MSYIGSDSGSTAFVFLCDLSLAIQLSGRGAVIVCNNLWTTFDRADEPECSCSEVKKAASESLTGMRVSKIGKKWCRVRVLCAC